MKPPVNKLMVARAATEAARQRLAEALHQEALAAAEMSSAELLGKAPTQRPPAPAAGGRVDRRG